MMGSWNAGGAGRVCVVSGVDVIYVCVVVGGREEGREGRKEGRQEERWVCCDVCVCAVGGGQ